MSSLRTQVGSSIRAHRRAAGISQADLAEQTDRSLKLVGQIERGASAPSFETLDAIAAALGVPVAALFTPTSLKASGGPRMSKLLERLSQLEGDDTRRACDMIASVLDWVEAARNKPAGQ